MTIERPRRGNATRGASHSICINRVNHCLRLRMRTGADRLQSFVEMAYTAARFAASMWLLLLPPGDFALAWRTTTRDKPEQKPRPA